MREGIGGESLDLFRNICCSREAHVEHEDHHEHVDDPLGSLEDTNDVLKDAEGPFDDYHVERFSILNGCCI